ncbi:C40 family peptidase [Clostridium neuense]|uniref:C40 family peptidase n=1 Tax=Clostridium neuense TaxID=1728934 RepID=A0ABW8TLB2_9CLOT
MNKVKKISTILIIFMLLLSNFNAVKVKANTVSDNGQGIVMYSKMFLGIPYLNGGITPAGFDCSGFVQYVYAHFGVNLPRTTYDQVNVGTRISKADLKPGDIVFFGSESNVYHDGIYIGGGRFIHSPRSGQLIRIEYLKYMDFYTGVRITGK